MTCNVIQAALIRSMLMIHLWGAVRIRNGLGKSRTQHHWQILMAVSIFPGASRVSEKNFSQQSHPISSRKSCEKLPVKNCLKEYPCSQKMFCCFDRAFILLQLLLSVMGQVMSRTYSAFPMHEIDAGKAQPAVSNCFGTFDELELRISG